MRRQKSKTRWVAEVTTDSAHPQKGLFTKDAESIARSLASKRVSPKGPGSGMRMLTYFINRGGKGLSASRRRELEKAKRLFSAHIAKTKGGTDLPVRITGNKYGFRLSTDFRHKDD